MTERSAFQVQILAKLGAPLMAAVGEVAARENKAGSDAQKQEAEQVAVLLNKAVQVSVSLAGSMDIKDTGAPDDSVRLALAALVGPLIAGQYKATGKVPGDNDIKRMITALEAVLTFSDNFAPAAENTTRLENMDPGFADENQIHIQYVGALVPVVNAIAAFPFGRPESKLVQEVTDRLVKKAESVSKGFVNGAAPPAIKHAELSILKALGLLYAECHQKETGKLMAMDEAARTKLAEDGGGTLSMDPVWQAFETRAGMIEVIGRSAVPEAASSPVAAMPPPAPEPQADEKPAEEPAPTAPPQPPAPEVPSVPDAAAPETPAAAPSSPATEQGDGEDGNYNPMGFFTPGSKKSLTDDEEGD